MRRAVDCTIAIIALLLLAPLLATAAVAVMVNSPGNPFYCGWRVGQHGRRFRMWKFRTMVSGADRMGPGITARQDARITAVGRFLRKTKIDELPQLINLLLGDMTLVGPRPEVPEIVARYSPAQRRILDFKPGLTSVGALHYTTNQVHRIPAGAAPEQFYLEHLLDEKLQMEIQYEHRRTALSDLNVVGETVAVILRALLPSAPQRDVNASAKSI